MNQQRLKELLHYDPATGVFRWRITKGRNKPWDCAGTTDKEGYRRIMIDGVLYYAHRLSWLYATGNFPPDQIDHLDGVGSNNALQNLRLATNKQNSENIKKMITNKSGFSGVSYMKKLGVWRADVMHNKKQIHLGRYASPELAAEAVLKKKTELFSHYIGREA